MRVYGRNFFGKAGATRKTDVGGPHSVELEQLEGNHLVFLRWVIP